MEKELLIFKRFLFYIMKLLLAIYMSTIINKGCGKEIEDLILHANRYVFLVVPSLDEYFAEKLVNLAKNGVDVKIITQNVSTNKGYEFIIKSIMDYRKSELEESYNIYRQTLSDYNILRSLEILLPVLGALVSLLFYILGRYVASYFYIGIPVTIALIIASFYKTYSNLKSKTSSLSLLSENYRRLLEEIKHERELLVSRLNVIGVNEKYFSARLIIVDGVSKLFSMNLTKEEINESLGFVSDLPLEIAEREFSILWALYEKYKFQLSDNLGIKFLIKERTR